MMWRARKKDGSVLDLEVMGSKLEHQGKDQVLIFCREAEAVQLPPTVIFQENSHFAPVQEPPALSFMAASNFSEAPDAGRAAFPALEEKSPAENAPNFDHEAKVHIKRIMEALNKAEKLRKNSGDLQKLWPIVTPARRGRAGFSASVGANTKICDQTGNLALGADMCICPPHWVKRAHTTDGSRPYRSLRYSYFYERNFV